MAPEISSFYKKAFLNPSIRRLTSKIEVRARTAPPHSQADGALKQLLGTELAELAAAAERVRAELRLAVARVGEVLEGPGFCRDDALEVLIGHAVSLTPY